MSYRRAELSKYLSQYSRQTEQLEDLFVDSKRGFMVRDESAIVYKQIDALEGKLLEQLNTHSIRDKLLEGLGNKQQLWRERPTNSYVHQPSQPIEFDEELLEVEARRLRCLKVEFTLELTQLRRIRYNLPLLESYEKVEEYNPPTVGAIRFLFFVFGEKLETEMLQSDDDQLLNAAMLRIRIRKRQCLKFRINFAESHLQCAQETFVHSTVNVVCIDEDGFVQAEGHFPAFQLLNHDQTTVELQSVWSRGLCRLNFKIGREESEVTRQASQKYSLLNNRHISIPEDKVLELRLQVLKAKSAVNWSTKRSKMLEQQHHDEEVSDQQTHLQLVQQYREQEKQIRNAAFLQSVRSEKLVELMANRTALVTVIISNLVQETISQKLEFAVQENTDKLSTGQLKFLTNQEQYDRTMALESGWKPKIEFTAFSSLQIEDQKRLVLPPNSSVTILFHARFVQEGFIKMLICNQPYAFLVNNYHTMVYKPISTHDDLSQHPFLANCLGLKLLHDGSKLQFRSESLKITSGYWQRLLVMPTNKLIPMDQITVKVCPPSVQCSFRHTSKHLEASLRCFSQESNKSIGALLLHNEVLVELVIVRLEIQPRKPTLTKRLLFQPNCKLYELDVSEFTEPNTRYEIKSMKPNFLQILSQFVSFPADNNTTASQLTRRHVRAVHVRLTEPLEDIEVELILYNTSTLSSTSVEVVLAVDAPHPPPSTSRSPSPRIG